MCFGFLRWSRSVMVSTVAENQSRPCKRWQAPFKSLGNDRVAFPHKNGFLKYIQKCFLPSGIKANVSRQTPSGKIQICFVDCSLASQRSSLKLAKILYQMSPSELSSLKWEPDGEMSPQDTFNLVRKLSKVEEEEKASNLLHLSSKHSHSKARASNKNNYNNWFFISG